MRLFPKKIPAPHGMHGMDATLRTKDGNQAIQTATSREYKQPAVLAILPPDKISTTHDETAFYLQDQSQASNLAILRT